MGFSIAHQHHRCSVNPDLYLELEPIIAKALEKDRKLRYHSAADVRRDLQRLKCDTGSGQRVSFVSRAVLVTTG
jgi:hypothetical protein